MVRSLLARSSRNVWISASMVMRIGSLVAGRRSSGTVAGTLIGGVGLPEGCDETPECRSCTCRGRIGSC